jgi:hypothetical protein
MVRNWLLTFSSLGDRSAPAALGEREAGASTWLSLCGAIWDNPDSILSGLLGFCDNILPLR